MDRFTLALVFLLVLGCSGETAPALDGLPRLATLSDATAQVKGKRVRRTVTVGKSDTLIVAELASITTARRAGSNIVLFDEVAQRIHVLELDSVESRLVVVASFGGHGRGPGELSEVVGVEVVGDEIILLDRGANRLERFSLRGELISAPALNRSPSTIAANDQSVFLVNAYWDAPISIGELSEEGFVELAQAGASFIARVPEQASLLAGRVDADEAGLVWMTQYSGRLIRVDNRGDIVFMRETISPPDLERISLGRSGNLEGVQDSALLVGVDSGKAFVGATDGPEILLDVYSAVNGDYEYSFVPPGIASGCGPRLVTETSMVLVCISAEVVLVEYSLSS